MYSAIADSRCANCNAGYRKGTQPRSVELDSHLACAGNSADADRSNRSLDDPIGKPMLTALKNIFAELSGGDAAASAISEQHELRLAVAGLLHEMMRVDSVQSPEESRTAVTGLAGMFGMPELEARALLDEAGSKRLTSYFDPASTIKRVLSLEQRTVLVENLWRVAFADGSLDIYEDQFVRKIADLIYVPNTESMLARQRAKNP